MVTIGISSNRDLLSGSKGSNPKKEEFYAIYIGMISFFRGAATIIAYF